jgi:single-strand DNA-binding protein
MAASKNLVVLIGTLGMDPILKFTSANKAVCNLKVATTKHFTDGAGKKHEDTEWHRVVVWGERGQAAAKYLTKGRQVYVQGYLKTNSWEKDGQKHYSTDIVADDVLFLGSPRGENNDYPTPPQNEDLPSEGSPARDAAPQEKQKDEELF